MILIALGANLPTACYGPPADGLAAALEVLEEQGVKTLRRSRWYRNAPVPPSGQPWYVNGIAAVETRQEPVDLLATLLAVERRFGRIRGDRNAARELDLDLIAYDDRIIEGDGAGGLVVPHPRLHERAFVLVPLAEVAPDWRHPRLGLSVAAMIETLGGDAPLEPLEDPGRN